MVIGGFAQPLLKREFQVLKSPDSLIISSDENKSLGQIELAPVEFEDMLRAD
jgi:hypothetical protein